MARFHESINWVEDNGKNGNNNYNVLLNRKYYTEGGFVMLTMCHDAFIHRFNEK